MVLILGPTFQKPQSSQNSTGDFGCFSINSRRSWLWISGYVRARLRRQAHWDGGKMFSGGRTTGKTSYQTGTLQKSLPHQHSHLLSITSNPDLFNRHRNEIGYWRNEERILWHAMWSLLKSRSATRIDDTLFNQGTNTSSRLSFCWRQDF